MVPRSEAKVLRGVSDVVLGLIIYVVDHQRDCIPLRCIVAGELVATVQRWITVVDQRPEAARDDFIANTLLVVVLWRVVSDCWDQFIGGDRSCSGCRCC